MGKSKPVTIRVEDLPEPGDSVELIVGDYEILVSNTADPNQMRDGDVIGFEPVIVARTESNSQGVSQVVHAAARRKAGKRSRLAKRPLCNRDGMTRVVNVAKGMHVVCTRCRGHLEEAGFVLG